MNEEFFTSEDQSYWVDTQVKKNRDLSVQIKTEKDEEEKVLRFEQFKKEPRPQNAHHPPPKRILLNQEIVTPKLISNYDKKPIQTHSTLPTKTNNMVQHISKLVD